MPFVIFVLWSMNLCNIYFLNVCLHGKSGRIVFFGGIYLGAVSINLYLSSRRGVVCVLLEWRGKWGSPFSMWLSSLCGIFGIGKCLKVVSPIGT